MESELVNIIIGIAVTVVGGILTIVIYDYLKNRVVVKHITKPNDKDLDNFFDLYDRLFTENERNSSQDIIRWIEETNVEFKEKNYKSKFYLIIAKIGKEVGGFFCFDYYLNSKYILINWIGIDKNILHARRFASTTLLKELRNILRRELKKCRGILFEIEAPDPGLSIEQNRERKARKALFKEYAKRQGLLAYEISIKYIQPKISVEEESEYIEETMVLMLIPTQHVSKEKLLKKEVLEILEFVYLDWYGDSYMHDEDLDQKYLDYLSSLLAEYDKNLPNEIPLRT